MELNDTPDLATKDSRAHLMAALKEFNVVMVATYDKKGKHPRLHPRPMAVAKLDPDFSMTFIARVPDEAGTEDASVIAQGLTRQVSLLGTVEYSTDKDELSKVWSVTSNLWVPGGKDDPKVGTMIFRPRDAELWNVSGRHGLRFLFLTAQALFTHQSPKFPKDVHDTLKLHRN